MEGMTEAQKRKRKREKMMEQTRGKMAKRLKTDKPDGGDEEANAEYIDASFILGTSDIVERFFSLCKYVLTDTRSSLTAEMFEMIVFLKANRDLWNLKEVDAAIKKAKSVRNQGI